MYKTTDMYEAAFLKVSGHDIGKVYREGGKSVIEVKGEQDDIQQKVTEFKSGAAAPIKAYLNELGFVRYLVQRAQ